MSKHQLIDTFLKAGVLAFGSFELKSGRTSPYFFNLGKVFQGEALHFLATAYAKLLHDHFPDVNILFGPAYKGIPLASTTATSYYQQYKLDVGVAFDRKEPKDHGEGGFLVGTALHGNIVMIDDVITAGSAVRSSLNVINHHGGDGAFHVQGLLVAMDRQEAVIEGGQSSIESLEQETGLKVASLLTFADLIEYIESNPKYDQYRSEMLAYREKYGAE